MTQEINEAAAAAMIEGQLAVLNLALLHGRLQPCFARVKPFTQAGKCLSAVISDLPRKNGWTIAEHAGDLTPDPTQRLLNHAVWDYDQAQGGVRRYVAEHLSGAELIVAALDESGQEKHGEATAGIKRQYMGCAGRIANGANTVYCSYATTGGHALIGAWDGAGHEDSPADVIQDGLDAVKFPGDQGLAGRRKPRRFQEFELGVPMCVVDRDVLDADHAVSAAVGTTAFFQRAAWPAGTIAFSQQTAPARFAASNRQLFNVPNRIVLRAFRNRLSST